MTEDGDQRILCWHFLPADGRLANGDGRKVVVGGTLSVEGKIKLQDRHSHGWGLHGSWRILDALGYASGPCVERCEVWGDVAWGVDQLAGRHRRTLAMADASDVLHHFACDWAERALWGVALQTGRAPDPRSLAAIETKRRWLRGEATDEELAGAARLAVRAAANVADCDAAWATYAVAYAARGVVYTAHATRGVAYTARGTAAHVYAVHDARAAHAYATRTARAAHGGQIYDLMDADLEGRVRRLLGMEMENELEFSAYDKGVERDD